MLKEGSKGQDVVDLQSGLKSIGLYSGRLDGIFGPKTRLALETWQCRKHATGEIGVVDLQEFIEENVLRPQNRRELVRLFGAIEYSDIGGGYILITNRFSNKNIVRVDLPIVGFRHIHYRLKRKFIAALEEVQRAGLDGEIKKFGTYSPRHVLHDPTKPLSLHSWGIACDINPSENPYGQKESKLHPDIVKAFVGQGFRWGGAWGRPDNQHFEYYR